ncbi:MAG TPA: Rieske (2Fe-2S) protein [bacterium]|nr:Rieske (2Fe-2S) protein [bacterium]
MPRHIVGTLSELPPGSRRIVTVDGRSIGVFNIRGRFYALRNRCPHQGAPLCRGRIKGTTLPARPYEYLYGREDEIIQCPWHGWEFEITTGRTYFNPHRMRVKTYDVTVERGAAEAEEDVALEVFEVTTEGDLVVLHA